MRNQQELKLFDHLIEGIQVISPDFRFFYVNNAFANQVNLPREKITGKEMLKTFSKIKKDDFYFNVRDCMKERTSVTFIQDYKNNDGVVNWFEFKIQPFDEGILIMSSDISEKKKIATELERKENRYRLLFEKMHEVFIVQEAILDDEDNILDMRLVEINQRGAEELGKTSPSELIGKLRTEYLGVLEGEIKEMVEQVIFEKKTVTLETYLHLEHRWLQIHSYSPQPNQIASLVIDITKQKENEILLEKLNHQLGFMVNDRTAELADGLERERKLNETKSSFLSMAAHELKTPLGAIKLSVDVLERMNEHSDSEDRQKYHGYILEEANNLLQLLDRFIKPLDQEIGVGQLKFQFFDLYIFLENIVQEFQGMCKEGQSIKIQYQNEKIVRLDKGILRRIIINLLNNAIKYSDDDVTIQVNTQSKKVIIKIIDKGIGIPKADQEKLFSKNFRATNASQIKGTGLGLFIVQTYVQLMEGTIDFKSVRNKGTTFTITLPF